MFVYLRKASEIGAHILSGNVFETRALDELYQIGKNLISQLKQKFQKKNFYF
jgi:electron-transferring-flavoprotein dehydrogenase